MAFSGRSDQAAAQTCESLENALRAISFDASETQTPNSNAKPAFSSACEVSEVRPE
jgi:hypothetical protein